MWLPEGPKSWDWWPGLSTRMGPEGGRRWGHMHSAGWGLLHVQQEPAALTQVWSCHQPETERRWAVLG